MNNPKDFFNWLCKQLQIDIDQITATKHFSGSISKLEYAHSLFKAHCLIESGDLPGAFIICHDIMTELLSDFRIGKENLTSSGLQSIATFFTEASQWEISYENFLIPENKEWLEYLYSSPLLKETEKNINLLSISSRRSFVAVRDSFFSRKDLRVMLHHGADPFPTNNISFQVCGSIVCADNIKGLINSLPEIEDDNIHFTVCIRIDSPLIFSHFIIFIQYKSSLWICTDQPFFANPASKQQIARRNANRYRDQEFQNTVLPYRLLKIIETYQKSTINLTTQHHAFTELYTLNLMNDLNTVERIYLSLFFDQLYSYIQTNDIEQAQTFKEYILSIQKQLPADEHYTMPYEDLSSIFTANKFAEERLHTLLFEQNSNVVLKTIETDLQAILDNPTFDANTLCTPNEAQKQLAWYQANQRRYEIQGKLNDLKLHKKEDMEQISTLIYKNLNNVLPYLFAGSQVHIGLVDAKEICFGSKDTGTGYIHTFSNVRVTLPNFPTIAGDNNNGADMRYCSQCERTTNIKHTLSFYIAHHSELQWLCGIKTEELPPFVANYRIHSLLPYVGNIMLDSTNPLYFLEDPCSTEYPNGLRIPLRICSYCRKRFTKKYHKFKNALILFSTVEAKPLGIVDYDKYRQENHCILHSVI